MTSLGKKKLQWSPLVQLSVRVHPAIKAAKPVAAFVRASDAEKIHHTKTVGEEKEPVPPEEVARSYEASSGARVVIDPDEFKAFMEDRRKEMVIDCFVPVTGIPLELYDKAYYLSPDESFARPFLLLRDAMRKRKVVAVTKFLLKGNREYVGIIRPYQEALMLHQLRYHEEIRDTAELGIPDQKVDPQELKLAEQLVHDLMADFDPTQYQDTLSAEYQRLIDERALSPANDSAGAGKKSTASAAASTLNLMDALKASLGKSQKSNGKKPPPRRAPSRRPAATRRAQASS